MAAYHRVDDEVLIRSPNGSVLSVSVAGLITDAGVTLAVEGISGVV